MQSLLKKTLAISCLLIASTAYSFDGFEGDNELPLDINEAIFLEEVDSSNEFSSSSGLQNSSRQSLQGFSNYSSVVTTGSFLPVYGTLRVPSRNRTYGIVVHHPIPINSGHNWEGFIYSLVVDGGYSGGHSDTGQVTLVKCVNWSSRYRHCQTLRDTSHSFSVQHDRKSFSGFPVVSNDVAYIYRVEEHIGPNQPYPYPSPVTILVQGKLYYSQ